MYNECTHYRLDKQSTTDSFDEGLLLLYPGRAGDQISTLKFSSSVCGKPDYLLTNIGYTPCSSYHGPCNLVVNISEVDK